MAYYKNPITRYILRKGIINKIRGRFTFYQRTLTKDLFTDIAFLLQKREVKTILDVGANVGFVTYQFQKRFPQAEIYCFEPNPSVFQQLKQNYANESHIHLYRQGIADECGELLFNLNANSGTSSFLQPTKYHHDHQARHMLEPILSPVITLDRFASESQIDHIDILKLDIEGYELNALKGAGQLLTDQNIDIIYTEVNLVRSYENQALFHELTAHLERTNYHLFNLDSFIAQETPVRQAIIGNALYISGKFRAYLEDTFGKENCGW